MAPQPFIVTNTVSGNSIDEASILVTEHAEEVGVIGGSVPESDAEPDVELGVESGDKSAAGLVSCE